VTTTGTPTAALSESGGLPDGVTFTDNGDGAATLAGTPTVEGVYSITIGATNGVAPDASQSFTLTVDGPPAITSGDSTTLDVGDYGTFTVTTTGTPTAALSESGSLPSGVTFTDNGDGTATLAGTPAAGTDGSYTITIDATNGVSPDATQSFTLGVGAAPAVTSADSTTFAEGSPGTFTVTATGDPTPTVTEFGNLPAGVTYSGGVLSGTPTASGSFRLIFTASNGVGDPANQFFTLTVSGLTITSTSPLPAVTEGTPYSYQLTATGGVLPLKWAKVGKLPTGLSVKKTGLITGTVKTGAATGTVTIKVKVTDSTKKKHQTTTASFSITINS
jgi:hypothetical protein